MNIKNLEEHYFGTLKELTIKEKIKIINDELENEERDLFYANGSHRGLSAYSEVCDKYRKLKELKKYYKLNINN